MKDSTVASAKPQKKASAMPDEKELSLEINVAVATLRNWRSKGEGPDFVKLGKRAVRYRRSAIDAFIAKGSKTEGGEQ